MGVELLYRLHFLPKFSNSNNSCKCSHSKTVKVTSQITGKVIVTGDQNSEHPKVLSQGSHSKTVIVKVTCRSQSQSQSQVTRTETEHPKVLRT